jgi:beta-glucosidase
MASGEFPAERLSETVRRIVRSIDAVGADAERPAPELEMDRHREAVLEVARQGIVLLKNEDAMLPLAADVQSIAVIGGHADLGTSRRRRPAALPH